MTDLNAPSSSSSTKSHLIVFAGLAILTGLAVQLSYLSLSRCSLISAIVLIAATQCTLIATFFMHLKNEHRNFAFMMLLGVFFVVVLLSALIGDIGR